MDTLSLVLTVIECFIVIAVTVSAAIALSKLSKVITFLPGSMKHMGFYLLGALMILESGAVQVYDLVSRNLHLIKKWLMFSCGYLRFSIVSDYRTISKNISSCVLKAGLSIKGELSTIRHTLLRPDSGGKVSSQSLALISQVILQ